MTVEQQLDPDEKNFPVYKVAVLVNELTKQGLELHKALSGTELTHEMLQHSTSLISAKELIKVYESAIRLTKDPAIGLNAGEQLGVTDYGMYGYALISSKNLREALEFSIKYHNLVLPTVRMKLMEDEYHGFLEVDNTLFENSKVIQFNIEFQFSLTFSLFKDMLGHDFTLDELHFEHEEPDYIHRYEQFFDCPLFFNQNKNRFKFKKGYLEKELVYANPITKDISKDFCDKALEETVYHSGLSHDIYEELLISKYQFPDIENVAHSRHMTSRTLRRKLKSQNTSFQEILNKARKTLATNYLSSSTMCIDEIASRLGYSNTSNFRNAFKKWTGITPSMFRKSL